MNPVTLPEPPTTLAPLERHVWYADRLREADVPFNPTSDPQDLETLYHAVYNGDYQPPPEPPPRPEKLQLERAIDGARFILDEPEGVPAAWGTNDRVLWAEGEGLMIVGPDGVGKTTLAQQLVLSRIGLADKFLALPVTPAKGKVLYIAADRPRQAARSFARMVTHDNEDILRDRLVVWRGPLPFDPCKEQRGLADLAELLGCTDIFVDSLKDIALDLSSDETGSRVNLAFQEVIARGIEVCDLHHQRKEGPAGTAKPKRLADVYGSRWLTAGIGSVILLWGEAGDAIVELSHLKQPAEEVGPFEVIHDHIQGRTVIESGATEEILGELAVTGCEVIELARRIFKTDDPSKNQKQKAYRKLEGLVKSGYADRLVNSGGKTVYRVANEEPF